MTTPTTIDEISPEVAQLIIESFDDASRYTLDHMTIVVKSTGNYLHDFIYGFPNQDKNMAAKPHTWRFVNPLRWKKGDVVSLLCVCEISNGYKSLTPLVEVQRSTTTRLAIYQSRNWNKALVDGGPQALLERWLDEH